MRRLHAWTKSRGKSLDMGNETSKPLDQGDKLITNPRSSSVDYDKAVPSLAVEQEEHMLRPDGVASRSKRESVDDSALLTSVAQPRDRSSTWGSSLGSKSSCEQKHVLRMLSKRRRKSRLRLSPDSKDSQEQVELHLFRSDELDDTRLPAALLCRQKELDLESGSSATQSLECIEGVRAELPVAFSPTDIDPGAIRHVFFPMATGSHTPDLTTSGRGNATTCELLAGKSSDTLGLVSAGSAAMPVSRSSSTRSSKKDLMDVGMVASNEQAAVSDDPHGDNAAGWVASNRKDKIHSMGRISKLYKRKSSSARKEPVDSMDTGCESHQSACNITRGSSSNSSLHLDTLDMDEGRHSSLSSKPSWGSVSTSTPPTAPAAIVPSLSRIPPTLTMDQQPLDDDSPEELASLAGCERNERQGASSRHGTLGESSLGRLIPRIKHAFTSSADDSLGCDDGKKDVIQHPRQPVAGKGSLDRTTKQGLPTVSVKNSGLSSDAYSAPAGPMRTRLASAASSALPAKKKVVLTLSSDLEELSPKERKRSSTWSNPTGAMKRPHIDKEKLKAEREEKARLSKLLADLAAMRPKPAEPPVWVPRPASTFHQRTLPDKPEAAYLALSDIQPRVCAEDDDKEDSEDYDDVDDNKHADDEDDGDDNYTVPSGLESRDSDADSDAVDESGYLRLLDLCAALGEKDGESLASRSELRSDRLTGQLYVTDSTSTVDSTSTTEHRMCMTERTTSSDIPTDNPTPSTMKSKMRKLVKKADVTVDSSAWTSGDESECS